MTSRFKQKRNDVLATYVNAEPCHVCDQSNEAKMTETQRNPEQDVVDDIDRLVTETMKAGRMRDYDDQGEALCPVCRAPWHGLPGGGKFGCPGEYGTDEEKAKYAKPVVEQMESDGLTMTASTWLPDEPVDLDGDDEIPAVRGHSAVAVAYDEAVKWLNRNGRGF